MLGVSGSTLARSMDRTHGQPAHGQVIAPPPLARIEQWAAEFCGAESMDRPLLIQVFCTAGYLFLKITSTVIRVGKHRT